MTTITTLGWNNTFQAALPQPVSDNEVICRVVADYGGYLKLSDGDEFPAEVAGKLKHEREPHELPKVGDWVVAERHGSDRAIIQHVLPRRSEISRKMPGGKFGKQILAANIDVAFVVQGLDHDFNLSRLERYTYQLRQSNIEPIFVFNKADVAIELEKKTQQIDELRIQHVITSTKTGQGLEVIAGLIPVGRTAVFLGSSGVGKSSLTNYLLGNERQKTAAIREDDGRGRHTTSHRELFILPNGGLVIDTPGIRELQLWGDEEFLSKSFADIESLALDCEFRNCSHTKELDCAVLQAIATNQLPEARLASYQKFKQELQTETDETIVASIKQKKQRARRLKKAISLEEKLRDDEYRYDG